MIKILTKMALFLLVWGMFVVSPRESLALQKPGDLKSFTRSTKHLKIASTSFEKYQKTIDDLFHITLMTNPNPEYGINSRIVELNEALKRHPDDVSSLISLGHIYRIAGQPEEANKFYTKALALDPGSTHLYCFSGMMLFQMEQFEASLEQLNQAVGNDPTDVHAWLARGRILLNKLHSKKEAIVSYEKALELSPENEEAIFILTSLYASSGQPEKSLQIFKILFKKNPDNKLIRYQLGLLYLTNQELEKALELWEALFYDGIRDPDLLYNLCLAYYEKKEFHRAEKILEYLQFMDSRDVSVSFLLGEVYRQLGQFEESERHFRMTIVENPDFVNGYSALIVTLMQLGKEEEAREFAEKAAWRFSNRDEFKVLLEALKESDLEALLT